jgi:hypothetical protein
MSEYKKTVPMGEIIRQEQLRVQPGAGEESYGSHSRPSTQVTVGEEEEEELVPDVIADTLKPVNDQDQIPDVIEDMIKQENDQEQIPDVIEETLAPQGEEEDKQLSDVIADTLGGQQ